MDLRSSIDLNAIAKLLPEESLKDPKDGQEAGPKDKDLIPEELQESTETLHYLVCNGLNVGFELWGKTLLTPQQIKMLVKPLNSIETRYLIPVFGEKLAQYSPFAELGFALTLILVQKAKEPPAKKEPEKSDEPEKAEPAGSVLPQ